MRADALRPRQSAPRSQTPTAAQQPTGTPKDGCRISHRPRAFGELALRAGALQPAAPRPGAGPPRAWRGLGLEHGLGVGQQLEGGRRLGDLELLVVHVAEDVGIEGRRE
eukprot:2425903-Prymnesium_polylepis.1